MGNPFLEKLEQGPLVCDGAMGTLLYEKGNFTRHVCFEELNLSQPSLVKEVHLGYRKAGADVLETNTFGANRFRLRNSGPEAKVNEINREGVRLARQVASRDLLVAGAVGPLGVLLEPMGTVGVTEAQEAFREQMEVLAESGVDLLMIETMTEVNEALQALEAARRTAPQLPVVVQMTIREDGTTPTGTRAEEFARRLEEAGADVIGLNCSVGPAAMLEALEALAGVTGRKLSVQPNAGLPRRVEGRYIYLSSPEYMADYAARFVRAGAALVGGCCGTTPEHIRQIKNTIQALRPRAKRVRVSAPLTAPEPLSSPPLQTRSRLAGKIHEGKFITLVEIIPPKGSDPKREIEGARYLARHGVDGVNIPEDHAASARMSAQILAVLIEQQTEIECLVHYCSRERNHLTIQSDLLGAYAIGLRNILAVTDDSPRQADYPETSAVFDIDAVGLVRILENLSCGRDVGGNPLPTSAGFLVAVRVNPGAPNLEEELSRLEAKVDAGANFILTLPVFDVDLLGRFWEAAKTRLEEKMLPVVAGLWPLTSYRNAEFVNNELVGIAVPEAILQRMRKVGSGGQARAEGIRVAQEILERIRPWVQGVQIATPFGRYDLALEVLGNAKNLSPEPVAGSEPPVPPVKAKVKTRSAS
ncbi:MAG: bifunctional homocysteine S-methyltransferase/methylenetetrahydrofolate reductase [Acidobacteria bacterium]|nr:bifunctional homocysteine S-methyltransferase/methylenetetrahydrofolate reductase [Acidobacteriota bacterium]